MKNRQKNNKMQSFKNNIQRILLIDKGVHIKAYTLDIKQCDKADVIKDLKNSSMPKIPLSNLFSIVICTIVLLSSTSESKKKSIIPQLWDHETIISFLHLEIDQPLFYWIVIDAKHESDNFGAGMDEFLGSIGSVKKAIDNYKEGSSHVQIQAPKLILEQTLQDSDQLSEVVKKYQLKLSQMKIIWTKKVSLNQKLYIRVKNDRMQLARLVEHLEQTVLSSNQNIKLTYIDRASIQRFEDGVKHKDAEISSQRQSLIQSQQLAQSILYTAQSHCQSLQMSLYEIISTKQLKLQQIQNQNHQNSTYDQKQDRQQMYYPEAEAEKIDNQSYQFFARTFEVKAKCTGNKPLKKVKGKNNAKQDQILKTQADITTAELQEQVKKHKKQKILLY